MKDVLNVKPVLLKQNAPQMDAFMKDVVNVKPVLLKQHAPKWMPFVTAVLNAKPFSDAPHIDAFGCLFCQR